MMEQYVSNLSGMLFLRKFDMFSQPFYHRVDYNQKTKKTSLGGFVSLCIVCLSLAYLIYILYLFFNNSYTPSVTSAQTTEEGLTTHTLQFSPFAFCFRQAGAIYSNWQNYFEANMWLDNNGNTIDTANKFSIKKCADVLPDFQNLASYFCIDTATTPDIILQTNQANPAKDILFNFALFIKTGCTLASSSCSPTSLMQSPDFVMEFAFIYQLYDIANQKLKLVMQREEIVIDPAIFAQDRYWVQQTQASIDNGFLLSSWTYYTYVSDFKKTQSYLTQGSKNTRFSAWSEGNQLLRLSQIQLTDSLISMTIQYPKISIVLAQFQSIFSTLLIAGILSKVLSENQNIEENMDILMNNYYKRSALEIDSYLEKKKDKKKNSKQVQAEFQSDEATIKDRSKIKNRLFDLNKFQLLKHFYSDCKYIKDDEQDPQLKGFKKVLQKQWSLMNVHQLHLEILRTKTALQMLLSEKQYASLEYIGRRLHPDENDLNHLESLEMLDENEELRMQKAKEYFQELSKVDVPKDPLDIKFKNSILKSIFEKPKENTDEEHALVPTKQMQNEVHTFNLENNHEPDPQ